MDIILKQDVDKLGYKDDIVTVKDGYARNFLIPQGMAVIANTMNKKIWEENKRQAAHKAAKIKQEAEELAERIGDTVFTVKAKVGETGKIFGKVTSLQLADAMKEKGYEVDRRKIKFLEEPKEVGTYKATAQLHKEVAHEINLEVVGE